MYYFAYGSNMNHNQMKERCPSSIFIKSVFLKDHKFVYDGNSDIRKGAVGNVIESPGEIVWGGLFEINNTDLAALDYYEGYNRGNYDRRLLSVLSDNDNRYSAFVYLRTGKKRGEPGEEYRKIVIQGARNCLLPQDYIDKYL